MRKGTYRAAAVKESGLEDMVPAPRRGGDWTTSWPDSASVARQSLAGARAPVERTLPTLPVSRDSGERSWITRRVCSAASAARFVALASGSAGLILLVLI